MLSLRATRLRWVLTKRSMRHVQHHLDHVVLRPEEVRRRAEREAEGLGRKLAVTLPSLSRKPALLEFVPDQLGASEAEALLLAVARRRSGSWRTRPTRTRPMLTPESRYSFCRLSANSR